MNMNTTIRAQPAAAGGFGMDRWLPLIPGLAASVAVALLATLAEGTSWALAHALSALAMAIVAGAIYVWPLTLILVLVGGFIGRGTGAIIGLIVSGVAGGIAYDRS